MVSRFSLSVELLFLVYLALCGTLVSGKLSPPYIDSGYSVTHYGSIDFHHQQLIPGRLSQLSKYNHIDFRRKQLIPGRLS